MKALLVYPEFPDTFWSYRHALRFVGKRAVTPPLGLLTVAAMLPEGWELRLVDLNVRRLRQRDLLWADVVLISAMTVQQVSARQVIARCKAAGRTMVAGGPLFTAQHEHFPDVDHFVLNEAEVTLPAFLQDFAAGRARRVYQSGEFADMRSSPVPRFELADLRRYAQMPVQYSRGCPFDCEFCDVTALFGRRPRLKSAGQLVAELDRLHELGWKGSVFVVDDNLIGNKRHVKEELLPALIDWQRRAGPTLFNSQASINLADDPELLALLAQAGFDAVFIGVETPDEAALAGCDKRQNVHRDLLADIRRIHAAGIQVQGGFIVGFDQDRPSIFQRQIEFIQASGIVTAMVGLLQAIRGTRLYERLQREKRLKAQEYDGDNVAGATNIVPLMDEGLLRRGYAQVLRTLYSPKGYYQRVRVFLRTYKRPAVTGRFRLAYLRAFLRAGVVLGVLGRERLEYWRLLFWTLLHRPRMLSMAVYLAILGHHYARVCRRYYVQAAGPA